jgi:hypothetical protein
MQSVNIHEAKTHFSRLLEQVQTVTGLGAMAGDIWMSDDFDLPLDDQFDCLRRAGP